MLPSRKLEQIIDNHKQNNKAVVIVGSRQVGKTTLLRQLFPENDDCMWFYGDDLDTQQLFANMTATRLRNIIGRHKTVVIDEAHRIQDIGLRMKLITDQMPEIKLVATGSSAFELANQLNEPLTGRKWEYRMYPLSFAKMVEHHGLQKELRMLPQRLVYGYYPEVVTSAGGEKEILKQLSVQGFASARQYKEARETSAAAESLGLSNGVASIVQRASRHDRT